MARKGSPKVRPPAPEMLRECRAIFRDFALPRRLTKNALATRIWGAVGLTPESDDEAALTGCLLNALRKVLYGLPPRQRLIVERSDLAGERNVDIASQLHVSVRHLYRQRALAFRTIAREFEAVELPSPTLLVPAAFDALELQLRLARGLEQNGQWPAAAEILERLCHDVADVTHRRTVESRLARLYTEVGRYSLAEQHIRHAFNAENEASEGLGLAKAEVMLSEARLLLARGNIADGQRAARHSHVELRSQLNLTHDYPTAAIALLGAANVSTEIAIVRHNASDAAAFSSESFDVLRQFRIRDVPALIETRFWHAAAQFVYGDRQAGELAENDLLSCYQLAVGDSQTRDAISIAVLLANHLRRTLRSPQVVELLKPLGDVVRSVAIGDELPGFFLELGNAALDHGDVSLAASCQRDLSSILSMNPSMRAIALCFAARLAFADGEYESSLKLAEAAETDLAKVGREGQIGDSLHLQAESLAKLGKASRALRTLRLALDHYRSKNQTHRLVVGYLAMASLTGDQKFRAKARDLRAQLSEPR